MAAAKYLGGQISGFYIVLAGCVADLQDERPDDPVLPTHLRGVRLLLVAGYGTRH